ncbi:heptaprenylglyceryl phosphate synthase [Geobacillus sp. YF-1]|uniref:heptaprenylglyceryl phosphate synthase n=1 Tax=Geobacillus sp. YF-1 TaxID=3457480 RepID=UPI004045232E
MEEIRAWRHVFKLDPNKPIDDERLERLCESGTDAVIVGGTDGVTIDGVLDLLARVRRFSVPCALEVTDVEALTPGFDVYLIPIVLNSRRTEWIIGRHHEAMKRYGDVMNGEELVAEGYCIVNRECKAAKLTEADAALADEDVVAYARLAEQLYRLPIFYLEYSGTYGDPALVDKVKRVLSRAQLVYGGGITTPEQAAEMARYADTVVVGNAIYESFENALATVAAVQQMADRRKFGAGT